MRMKYFVLFIVSVFLLMGCSLNELFESTEETQSENTHIEVTPLNELTDTQHFKNNALKHILEGELNYKGQAVGFHYNQLETKKGEIIEGTRTKPDENGVYEAKVIVSDVEKTSNNGKSTFFSDNWDTQEVVDAINEAYDNRVHINGNTFEGLTNEGIVIRMYLDDQNKIISAFPVY